MRGQNRKVSPVEHKNKPKNQTKKQENGPIQFVHTTSSVLAFGSSACAEVLEGTGGKEDDEEVAAELEAEEEEEEEEAGDVTAVGTDGSVE